MLFGYARVSSTDGAQSTDLQIDALRKCGCLKIFEDQISGARDDRPGLNELLNTIQAGDTIVVWKLDRLGRSVPHLLNLIEEFKRRQITFRSLTEVIDTGTPTGAFLVTVLCALAQMERSILIQRTRAGLAAAKERGRISGRPNKLSTEQINLAKQLLADPSNSFKCADPACGLTILYDPKIKKLKHTGEIVTYHYYHCTDGRDIHKNSGIKQVNISEQTIWKGLETIPAEICINERLAKAVSAALKATHDKAITEHKETINHHKQEIATKEREEDKATELLMNGILEKDVYGRTIKKNRDEKRHYVDLLEQSQLAITDEFYETSEKILELCMSAKTLWEKANVQERLQFLEKVLSN